MNLFSFFSFAVFATCSHTTVAWTTTVDTAIVGRHAAACADDLLSPSSAATKSTRSISTVYHRSTHRNLGITRLSASRRDTLITALSAGATMLSVSAVTTNNAHAADTTITENTIKPKTTCKEPCFTGVWSDPQHPNGYRVLLRKSETVATMIFSDGGDSNSINPKVFKGVPVKVNEIKSTKETELIFDFSFKAPAEAPGSKGSKHNDLVIGKLTGDGTKIIFQDGNVWTKNVGSAVEGVYATDPRVAGQGYRVVVIRKDNDNNKNTALAVQLNSKQAMTGTLTKQQGGKVGVSFVFPDHRTVDATYENGVIKFPFPVQSNASGNTITKWDEWIKL